MTDNADAFVLPDWAPDDCPPKVVQLIEDEQYLEDLGLRGLASADSAALHQACRNLQRQLAHAYRSGRKAARRWPVLAWYLGAGYLVGALSAAVLFAILGPG